MSGISSNMSAKSTTRARRLRTNQPRVHAAPAVVPGPITVAVAIVVDDVVPVTRVVAAVAAAVAG